MSASDARRQRRIEAATKLLKSPIPGERDAARAALIRLQGWSPDDLERHMDMLFLEGGVLNWYTGDGRIEIEGDNLGHRTGYKAGLRLYPPAFIRYAADFMADAGKWSETLRRVPVAVA